MVNTVLALISTAMIAGKASLFPKDSTTLWCGTIKDDVYACFPNPWGEDLFLKWYRFRSTPGINGCLIGEGPYYQIGRYDTTTWYSTHRSGGPILSRLTFTYDPDCDRIWAGKIKNTAASGDSILMEFKMTPADTAVPDTIRGEMRALYLVEEEVSVGRRQSLSSRLQWSSSGLRLPPGARGPVELRRLDGQAYSSNATVSADGLRAIPMRRPDPGLYLVRWVDGSGLVLVPPR
jgi:hypothetical protein